MRELPVLAPDEVALSLANILTTGDLTALLDFLLTGERGRGPLSSRPTLETLLSVSAGRRGVDRFRRALSLARVGPRSPPETTVRLLLGEAGLPEPELNMSLWHPSGRQLIPDLAWPRYRVATEYNGGYHDEPDQRVHDLRRMDDFTDLGWLTVNVEKVELFGHPESVVERVSARLRSRGWDG